MTTPSENAGQPVAWMQTHPLKPGARIIRTPEEDDCRLDPESIAIGWVETPLYPADALTARLSAAEAERDAARALLKDK